MYLDKGWENFAIAHSVDFGCFLHFKYEGDYVLTVKVFDRSMCRRHYQHDELCYSSLDFNVQLFRRCEGLVFDELRPCVRG